MTDHYIFFALTFASMIGAQSNHGYNLKADIKNEPIYLIGQADGKSFFTTAVPTDLNEGVLWDEWTNFCQRNGFYTASIESQAQNDLVNSFWTSFPDSRPLWLGAMDLNTEQNFYWMRSYQNLNYSSWGLNSPYNDPSRNCVYIYKRNFTDIPCTTKWIPLCEYP